MSDLFHERVPVSFIKKVFETMNDAEWHTFQVLTKRSERAAELASTLDWPSNVWMGVSVETAPYLWRVDHLREIPAAVRFLSIEPLLGRLGTVHLDGIDWVIVGGESGPRARPLDPSWVKEIRDQCLAGGIPFFFKQWGGVRKTKTGRVLEGRTWDELPAPRALRSTALST
jgi:protein gp37